MGTEKLTSDNLLRHMSDDPCVVCGDSGHNAWGTCKKLSGPISHTSPLVKIFGPGNKASTARTTIITYRKPNSGKTPWVEPAEPAADAPAPVDAKAQAQADAEAAAKVEDKMISEAIDPDNKSIEGLKKVRDITQAETVVTRAAASKSLPDNVKLGLSNSFAPKKVFSKSRTSLFPLRKEFAKEGLNEVFTNHFEVKFKPNTRFFVYEILRIPNAKSKRKAKYIFKTAEEAWDVLRSNRDQYATDHVKTIVAWKNLHESMTYQRVVPGDQTTNSGAVWLPEAIADGNERIQLAIKFHWELDLAGLNAYLDASHADSKADFNFNPIVDALNLAVTKSLTDKVFQQSTNKFFVKCGSVNLGRTLCTIRGYYYTIKPGMQKVLLNVNAATSAFFQPTTVGEYLNDNTTFPLDEREKTLKLLRVYIEPDRKVDPNNQEHVDHLNKPQNRIKTFFGYGEKLNHPDMTFKKGYKDAQGVWQTETKPTTVEKHMEAVFGKSFDPTQPAINVGTKDNPIYYPREYLRILPYQIYKRLLPDSLVPEMLNSATHLPARSRQLVEVEGMNSLGLDPTQTEQPLPGCPQLLIKPTMMKIPCVRMPSLDICYGEKSPDQQPLPNAQWNLTSLKSFIHSPGATDRINYLLLVDSIMQDKANTTSIYETAFNNLLKEYGICTGAVRLAAHEISGIGGASYDSLKTSMKRPLENMKKARPTANFAILLLKSRSIPAYAAFKEVVDRHLGLQSLCMTQTPNIEKGRRECKKDILQYMANIMMKANLKWGGGNHTVQLAKEPKSKIQVILKDTLVLGADLTHPGPGSLVGCPSTAAVVGSVDSAATRFRGSMRLQDTCKKDIIDHLEAMVGERINEYLSTTNSLPKRILFYRDGVSTSQYAAVRDQEMRQIQAACKAKGCANALITIVVAVKRHATRFYPATPSFRHRNGNCLPGTLVDRLVTSPHYADFYLQSHHGLKGTAIPTHYFVIANEIGYKDTELQQLTYKLCYTYARATIGVSYAPPAYYADRLCDRGRAYLRDWFSPDRNSTHYQAYLTTKARIEQQQIGRLQTYLAGVPQNPVLPGRNAAKKTTQQIGIERAHKRHIEGLIAVDILAQARAAWQAPRAHGPGPWAGALDKTMFWM